MVPGAQRLNIPRESVSKLLRSLGMLGSQDLQSSVILTEIVTLARAFP